MGDPLKASPEKDNFQRLAQLLFCGGKNLLKEVFDSFTPPNLLPVVLKLVLAKPRSPFNAREISHLNPSPDGYGTSADFDITLLFKLVRHLCNIPVPATGWDNLPNSTDKTLSADLARIKFYRNKICHDNNNMEIDDATFQNWWQEISEAIVRIAESISDETGNEWKARIDGLLKDSLTADDHVTIQKGLQDVKRELQLHTEELTQLKEEVRDLKEEGRVFREEVGQHFAELTMKIECQSISQGGSAGYQNGNQGAPMYHPVTERQILSLIGLYYMQVKQPSSSLDFSHFHDYMSNMEVSIRSLTIGSLLITLEINTLPILERLWEDYCSGHLGEVVQRSLATSEILNDLGLTELKLKTTILEQDYRTCKQSLKEFADTYSSTHEKPHTSKKRTASEAKEVKKEAEEAAYKRHKLEGVSGSESVSESKGDRSIVRHHIKQEQSSSTKRTASEAFTSKGVIMLKKEDEDEKTANKFSKLEDISGDEDAAAMGTDEKDESVLKSSRLTEGSRSQSESEDLDEDWYREIVFAADSSSDVSKEEFQKQIQFVKYLAKSLNVTPGSSRAALIAYGDDCKTLIPLDSGGATHFSVQVGKLEHKPEFHGKGRRIDSALSTAADILKSATRSNSWRRYKEEKDQLVILTTAGMQSLNDPGQENPDALSSVAESLQKENVKIIIVSLGSGVNFEELVQVIERPQYLFPLLSFSDLTETKAQEIAKEIVETADIVKYTTKKVMTFPGVSQNPDCGLGEKISQCLDVMEGAWNLLYRPKNWKSGSHAKEVVGPARKRIQQGLSDFHSRLVLDSNITVKIAVFGTEGAGKSTLLNFLLNQGSQGVPGNLLNEGPLPSGKGTRQTRLPIYVKYAKSLQILLHKDRGELKPEVLFPNLEHRFQGEGNPLTIVRDLLKNLFHREDVLEDVTRIELQGPFSIFCDLEERRITSSNHLELQVDVELVDLPGLREDQKGDKVLISELSKADLILFFTSGQEGREVTPHDLATVFRQHGKFDFSSRPKLIHVVKASTSDDFDKVHRVNQKVLEKVWKEFFDDSEGNKCYKLAREKLPSLGGEDLLKKLEEESEVLVFHPENKGFIPGLKDALSRHVKDVKTKESFHPSLKDLHRLAKDLNKTISGSASRANKAPQEFHKVTVGELAFKVITDEKEKEDLIESFIATDDKDILQQEDMKGVYKDFMYSDETSHFVQEALQISLDNFSDELIAAVEDGYRNASMDISDGLRVLAEVLCNGKVRRFCSHRALRYFHWCLERSKGWLPTRNETKSWSNCDLEDRKGVLRKCLVNSLGKALKRLESARGSASDISLLKVREILQSDIEKLFSVRSLENVPRNPDILKGKLQLVIGFSREAIRDYNPEFDLSRLDSFDHTKDFPEELRKRSIDNSKPNISCAHERIIKEMVQLLKTKKGDPVRELEKKLKFEKSDKALAPPSRSSVREDPGEWPSALLTVLSDEDHFDIPLDDNYVLGDEILQLARKRLFSFQRSRVECQIVKTHLISGDEIHIKKHTEQPNVLVVSMTDETLKDLDKICTSFTDCKTQLAPIFIPTIRPGPQQNRKGNYFLQENPWEESENEAESVDQSTILEFNIFLVVEERHLEVLKSTVAKETQPVDRKINLRYIVLPQNGRGIGVTRAIIKTLAESFKFDLYWTVDDDIKFMYQFNENDRRWHKCTFGRGLLFGQRVFQHCRQPALKQLSETDMNELVDEVLDFWPGWAKKSQSYREARSRLLNETKLQKLRDSPGLLHSPFTDEIMSKDCGKDDAKKEELRQVERKFVETCRNCLFEDAVNHIAGVSLAHQYTGKSDYMGRYPSAHFMPSTQRYQVVLHNAPALRGRNYVTDEMIFEEEEDQIAEKKRRNTGYWGIKHCDKSFSRALEVSGIFGYQVICINHVHKKGLVNAYEAIGPSYEGSMSPYGSEEEI